jgi:hypothetical protein
MDEFTDEGLMQAVLIAADRLDEISARAASFAVNLGVDRSLETLLARTVAAAEEPRGWFKKALKRYVGQRPPGVAAVPR